MPMDMRDAIAHYLAYTGGRGGQALPLQAYRQLPSGQYLPDMLSDTFGMPQTPPSPDYTGPQGTNAPPVPANLQGYERLPSGQFLPGAPPIGQAEPSGEVPPGLFPPMTPQQPFPQPQGPQQPQVPWEPPWMSGQGPRPPDSTPMQAPYGGQTVAGMDPAEWLRMYRGGAGA